MADSAIGSLPAVQLMQNADLFVLEQNGEAKKLSGELLSSFIDRQITSVTVVERAATDTYTASYNSNTGALTLGIPRGVGIASISDPVVSGLNKTYTITFDKPASASAATKKTFTVKDGNAITGIQAVSDPHTPGTRDRYQINFSEGEPFEFEVYNGQDGYGSPGSSAPLMDSTAAVGTAHKYAREDHVHPTDTSRQEKLEVESADLTFNTQGVDTNSTSGQVTKYGRIVILTAVITPTISGVSLILASVPNDYKPINEQWLSSDFYQPTFSGIVEVRVDSDGNIAVSAPDPVKNHQIKISGSWISAE